MFGEGAKLFRALRRDCERELKSIVTMKQIRITRLALGVNWFSFALIEWAARTAVGVNEHRIVKGDLWRSHAMDSHRAMSFC